MNALPRYAVLVPSLHPNDAHFLPFLDGLLRLGPGAVVVVDDGSGEEFRPAFERAGAMGCIVLRHDENRGKGRALKTGLEYCGQHLGHLDGVVTADSDGQHLPEDIAQVCTRHHELASRGEDAVVLGSRAFGAADVPPRSRFGNQMTSRLVKLLFGRHVSDTQTGLRCLSQSTAAAATLVRGERFEYEMNQLLWLLGTRQTVVEVSIRTVYHDLSNSISHFRPLRDSLQIYCNILRQFFGFAGVSLLSFLLDIALYYVLVDHVFGAGRSGEHVALAVVVARIVSSLVNFGLNRRLVFRQASGARRSLARYYVLAGGIMVASAAGTTFLAVLSGGHVMWAKVVCDAVLFGASYVLQRRWVFPRAQAAVLPDEASRQSLVRGDA